MILAEYKALKNDGTGWVHGLPSVMVLHNMKQTVIQEVKSHEYNTIISMTVHEVYENTICKWCDCEDAEGVKIFEGDIMNILAVLDDNHTQGIVYWCDQELAFKIEFVFGGKTIKDNLSLHLDGLVVGNIHDTSESVTVTKDPISILTDSIKRELTLELRKKTGFSMMDCKTALSRQGWDMEMAHEWLGSPDWKKGKLV